jgi:hypothetical protein
MTEHHVSKASFKNPVVRGWGQGGEMTQALYAHMNNKTIKKNPVARAQDGNRSKACPTSSPRRESRVKSFGFSTCKTGVQNGIRN